MDHSAATLANGSILLLGGDYGPRTTELVEEGGDPGGGEAGAGT